MKSFWAFALSVFFTSTVVAGELNCGACHLPAFSKIEIQKNASPQVLLNAVDCNQSQHHDESHPHSCTGCSHAPLFCQTNNVKIIAKLYFSHKNFFLQHWKASPFLNGLLQPPRQFHFNLIS